MRRFCGPMLVIAVAAALGAAGCSNESAKPERVWGKRGVQPGELVKPRAIAIDGQGRLYLVDWSARIQVYDLDGKYLGPTWTTPDYRNGRPSGLSIDRDGNLLVSDSHYSCLRIYSPDGKLLKTLGGKAGPGPGELGYVSDAVQDADGFYYVAEFGDNQRVSKFDAQGKFVKCWGGPGTGPGEFSRIRALALGPDGLLYLTDACNHRIQVFTREGELVRVWGTQGTEPGELSYPYDIAFSPTAPNCLYVAEFGNNRIQKFTPEGVSLGIWGSAGRESGKLASPWALAIDSSGRVHVVDSENDRVQRIRF
jgi:DNA-binding beta-propeller fold protein YncE